MTAASSLAGAATVELVSRTATAADSFGTSDQPALSDDGRYTAFLSDAANLVPGQEDDNNGRDVFLHHRVLGTTTLVSHVPGSPKRAAGTGQYNSLEISADGRYVAFSSSSPDLAPGAGDNGNDPDVFLWDRLTETTTLVSHAAGVPGTAAAGPSSGVHISADGNFLVVISGASNLVAGQAEPFPNGRTMDVFLWSRATDTMTLLSRKAGTTATAGNQSSLAADVSGDGNVVVFASLATDLIPIVTVQGGAGDIQAYAYERSTNTLTLVSRSATTPNLAVGISQHLSVSAGGRWVAFASNSNDLVPGQVDNETSLDAFLYDRETGEMRLVSHKSASPLLAGGIFGDISMSVGGRYVAFSSLATDLVPGQVDTNQGLDVFVWDRNTGLITLVSHHRDSATTAGSTGATGVSGSPKLSADGRFVAFQSIAFDLAHGQTDLPGTADVFLYDQTTRNVTLVSRTRASDPVAGNGPSFSPVLSADGSVTAFISEATNLGEGQIDPYGFRDLFLYHRTSGEITSPSQRDPSLPSPLTDRYPSILGGVSADGRSVVYENLSLIFLRDTVADTTEILGPPLPSPDPVALSRSSVLSADGRVVAFLSTHPGAGSSERLYLYDRAAGTYSLVNHVPGSAAQVDGIPSSFALSADARYVAYQCSSCGLVPGHPRPTDLGGFPEIFLYDRVTGRNTLVSHAAGSPAGQANGPSFTPAISANGRYVAFWSTATNLFAGQIDVSASIDLFVFDRETGGIELVTHVPGSPATAAGLPSVSFETPVHLSADGRFLVFQNTLTNLLPGQVDTSGSLDVFLRDRTAGSTVLVSHAASSPVTAANRPSHSLTHEDPLSLSADGRFVVYESLATDLVAGATDTNNARDVFLYDRVTGANSLVSHAGGAPRTAGNGDSEVPRISADGTTIAFLSGATDLAPGQTVQHPFPASRSLYVWHRSTDTTAFAAQALKFGRPFSLFPIEEPLLFLAPQISADGRRIAFTSDSALVLGDYNRTWDVYLWEGTVEPEEPEGPFPVTPCRLLDTRRRAERPILTSNVPRTVTAHGRCGVPATAREVLVKVTVFNPSGKGNLRFYAGAATGNPSGILRFERGATRTGTFTLPLGPNGTLTILPLVRNRGTVHVSVEVNGYDN